MEGEGGGGWGGGVEKEGGGGGVVLPATNYLSSCQRFEARS